MVDFIDMHKLKTGKAGGKMRLMMENDRAKHNILPLSKFGLMQITRQRVRPVIDIDIEETCPTCYDGDAHSPRYLFTDQLESKN